MNTKHPMSTTTKSAARVRAGLANVLARQDHLPSGDLQDMLVPPQKTNHQLKIERYRHRLLTTIQGHIDPELYVELDQRSLELLDKLPDNTEFELYSGLCQYVEYCVRCELTPLPFAGYV